MGLGLLLQLVEFLEQLFLSSLAFFESNPQRIDSKLPVDGVVLLERVDWIRTLKIAIRHWLDFWFLVFRDLRRILLLGLDDVIIRRFLLLPLGWWLELFGFGSSLRFLRALLFLSSLLIAARSSASRQYGLVF